MDETVAHYRLWPPAAVGVPLAVGLVVSPVLRDPWALPIWVPVLGWVLLGLFALWNGWCLVLFARRRTGLLPGQRTESLLDSGPFRLSRNPLYLGLLFLHAGVALVTTSVWALVTLPVSVVLLEWGAIGPEEAYLRRRLGSEYDAYAARVRRWI